MNICVFRRKEKRNYCSTSFFKKKILGINLLESVDCWCKYRKLASKRAKKKNEPYNDCEKKRFCFLPAFEAQTLANRDII